MPSPESLLIRETIVRDSVPEGVSITDERQQWEAFAASLTLAAGIRRRPEQISGVPCEWLEDASSEPCGMILYVHGGGLIAGSPSTHAEFASRLVRRLHRRVLLVDYRLAPEHPYPAALHDVRAVYAALLERIPTADLVLGGESSGAGLALSVLLALRDAGLPLPAAAFFISGHFDLTLSGDSMLSRRAIDSFTSPEALERASAWYAKGADRGSPALSPVFAELGALPPILLQVGDHEILLSDSLRVAERIASLGGRVELRVWDAMWHNWPMYAELPEADAALIEVGEFVDAVSGIRR